MGVYDKVSFHTMTESVYLTTYLSVHLQHEVKYINVNGYFDSCPINNSISRDLVFYVKNRSLDQNTKLAIDMIHIVFDFNIRFQYSSREDFDFTADSDD